MSKEKAIKTTGLIVREEGSGFFRVTLENPEGHSCLCRASGRLVKNHIQILSGDRVEVELSPYDLDRGRITMRFK